MVFVTPRREKGGQFLAFIKALSDGIELRLLDLLPVIYEKKMGNAS